MRLEFEAREKHANASHAWLPAVVKRGSELTVQLQLLLDTDVHAPAHMDMDPAPPPPG